VSNRDISASSGGVAIPASIISPSRCGDLTVRIVYGDISRKTVKKIGGVLKAAVVMA